MLEKMSTWRWLSSLDAGLMSAEAAEFWAGAFAALIYSFVVTFILATIIDKTIGLRVTEEEEYVGLDISQHGERA